MQEAVLEWECFLGHRWVHNWLHSGGLCYRKLSEKAEKADKSGFFINALNMSAGVLILYTCGFIQLMFVADIGPGAALALGVIPFLLGEIIKTGVAAYIASTYKL